MSTPTAKYRRSGFCGFPAVGDPARTGGPITDWHGSCKGAVRNGNGNLVYCDCPCHEHRPVLCLDCGYPDHTGGQVDLVSRVCLDHEACRDRIAAHKAASPVLRMIADTVQRARANPPPTPAASTKPRRATSGRCEHCGAPTRGGKFLAGHDAKLRGDLMKAVAQNDAAARAEQLCRGGHWARSSHPLDYRARILIEEAGGEAAYLAIRIRERIGEEAPPTMPEAR